MEFHDFDRVYSNNKEMVWRLASRYVSGRSDIEDLFQDIFLKIHRSLPKFRGDSSVGTWIYRIAVNESINFLRKKKRSEMVVDLLKKLKFDEDGGESAPEEPLFVPLNKLNPRQRMIILLSDVEEKKLEEISDALNIPVGTVKSNLHRAREIIKKEVSKNGDI